ncbi:glycosyltransferase family 2 protein [Schumannella soli]|uniref:Glycosyltransferase family 2 protein n=1 Tax=Schumannella soli TaxID=2590779 RepID=A0A506Y1Y8_9MICO|nr:glycosyltransferase family 2 protein [Schumannella soli]TPW75982.1 glycosyltransferase family 2 protein [Schumannella soli]
MTDSSPLLSLIVPAYNEVESVEEIVDFFRDIRREHPEMRFELLVIDDGSSDGTLAAIEPLFAEDEAFTLVQLSRNFGSHAAISAGLAYARGDAALTLSADRQEPLSAVGQFIEAWRAGGELVWGLRSTRAMKRGLSNSFAEAFSRIYQANSDVPTYPKEGPSQILLARRAIDAVVAMPELNRNVLAMAAWTGFDQRAVYFEQLPRPHGVSKWTLRKKMKLVVDSFVQFSHAPLEWIAWGGLAIGAVGALALLTALVLAFTPASAGSGTALVSGLVLAVGGMNLVGMGVLGEYIWRAGDDARRRPVFIVRRVRGSADASGARDDLR